MRHYADQAFSWVNLNQYPVPPTVGCCFDRVFFDRCSIGLGDSLQERPLIQGVRLMDCKTERCQIGAVLAHELEIHNLEVKGRHPLLVHGAFLSHVRLSGRIGRFILDNSALPSVLSPMHVRHRIVAEFEADNAERYTSVDWALDISKAEFREATIRGVPTHLIRRDPETQVVIRRSDFLNSDWRGLPFESLIMPVIINEMLSREDESAIIVAPKANRTRFAEYMTEFEVLRKAGLAS